MTKPSLKERLEKKWLGRRVKTCLGDVDTIIEISNNLDTPLVGCCGDYCPSTVTRLKPKQKKPKITYTMLAEWWNSKLYSSYGFYHSDSVLFQSLCELLGVKKS